MWRQMVGCDTSTHTLFTDDQYPMLFLQINLRQDLFKYIWFITNQEIVTAKELSDCGMRYSLASSITVTQMTGNCKF